MEHRDIDSLLEDTIKEHRRDAGRSGEEIERFTVDENLSDLNRAKLFLSPTAHQLQQSCALESLPKTFHEYGEAAYRALFPAFTSSLESYNSQAQMAAGEAFITIMKDTSLPKDMGLWLLPTALSMLNANRNQDISGVWLKALCAVIPSVPLKVISEDLMRLALAKGESQETVQSRTTCCAILGAIAPLLQRDEIENQFLHKAMALCQDTDLEVRVCMCEQLNAIARAVGVETTKEKILPELYELLKDEEVAVRTAAFESLVQMLDYLPSDTRNTKIMPFLRSMTSFRRLNPGRMKITVFCAPNESTLLITLPRLLGEVMCKMVFDLSEDDFQSLLDAYKSFVRHVDEEVRQLSASSFPAVLKSIGARKYASTLHVVCLQLVQDPSSLVRSKLAASFHEIAKMLGKKRTASYLKEPLVLLLEDNARDVQESILKVLPFVLGYFAVGTPQQKATLYESLLPSLIHAEKAASSGRQWRLQLYLLQAFTELPDYLTSDQIYENFVPICFCYMADGVIPVKAAATLALAIFIRNNRKASQRYELSSRVLKEYAHARSYWSRMVFIDFCESMLKVASTRMFKDTFLDSAISSLQDPVASVRMRACLLLPQLKYVIKLPEDVVVLEKINHLTTQRLNDSVKEVAATAQCVADGFKHVLRSAINDRDHGSDLSITNEDIERVDKQREEEEWNMLSKEEQEEKKKLDEVLQRMKLEGGSRRTSITGQGSGGSQSQGILSPQDSAVRYHSRPSPSGRQSITNGSGSGSRSSVSSSSSRTQGSMDLYARSMSRVRISSLPNGNTSQGTTIPGTAGTAQNPLLPSLPTTPGTSSLPSTQSSGIVSRRSVGQSSSVAPGARTQRLSSQSATPALSSARPASPAVNLRPQTPSSTSINQDIIPPTVAAQRNTPSRNSKVNAVTRRTSSS